MNKLKQTKDRNTQKSLLSWFGDKKAAQKGQQDKQQAAREITKEEEKYQQQLWDGELDENSDDFHKLQKVVKVKEVQKVRL